MLCLPLGSIVATPGALKALSEAGVSPLEILARHDCGDWGDICSHDWRVNDEAIWLGHRVLSSYMLPTKVRVWIITGASRELPTILLPDEY